MHTRKQISWDFFAKNHNSIVKNIQEEENKYWIDRIVLPKVKLPLKNNSRDILRSHLSKIIRLEQNLGKVHIDYTIKPKWWDNSITFSNQYSVTGKMNKENFVSLLRNAYAYHGNTSSNLHNLHIERSKMCGNLLSNMTNIIKYPLVQLPEPITS